MSLTNKYLLHNIKKLNLIFVLITYNLIIFSQNIENVDYNLVGNSINIFYDISNYYPAEKYDIKVEFVDDRGQVITPRTLTGDYGIIKGGQGKKIVWSVFQDTQGLTGNYQAVVRISRVVTKNHSGFYNLNLPGVSLLGVKYAYLGKYGGYVSASIVMDDDDPLVVAGPLIRVANTIYPYAGFGINVFTPQEVLAEGGIIISPRAWGIVAIDFGLGVFSYTEQEYSSGSSDYIDIYHNDLYIKVGIGIRII